MNKRPQPTNTKLVKRGAYPCGRHFGGKTLTPTRLREAEAEVNPTIFWQKVKPGIPDGNYPESRSRMSHLLEAMTRFGGSGNQRVSFCLFQTVAGLVPGDFPVGVKRMPYWGFALELHWMPAYS